MVEFENVLNRLAILISLKKKTILKSKIILACNYYNYLKIVLCFILNNEQSFMSNVNNLKCNLM